MQFTSWNTFETQDVEVIDDAFTTIAKPLGCLPEIAVNAVAPGPTATDLFLHGKSDELIERFAKMNPLERLGAPQHLAAAVAFLAGPDGSWINGRCFAPMEEWSDFSTANQMGSSFAKSQQPKKDKPSATRITNQLKAAFGRK